MTPPLTIRNLTAAPISLRRIERFEDPNSRQSKAGVLSFGFRNTTSLAPSAPVLGEHAQTFDGRDLHVTLLSYESWTLGQDGQETDGNDAASKTSMTLRVTIETQRGDRYRIDTNPSYTQKSSFLFTPLAPNPSESFTALYHPAHPTPHLTIHTNHLHDLSRWMSALPSELPLSALSIPGTHNSHTCYRALPSVKCQSVPILTQLNNGIRFLDIRLQPTSATDLTVKDLYLVHGAFPISLTGPKYFAPILKTCYEFLDRNPSETILISLKREGVGNATDEHFSRILHEHYIAPHRSKWYTHPTIPYLSSTRGKLVLIRRYNLHPSLSPSPDSPSYGLDATAWPHNTTHALHGPFCVQDFCEVLIPSIIQHKLHVSNEHLDRAAACEHWIPGVNTDPRNPLPPGPVYLNFLSGSNFWKVGCWPGSIARVVNRGVEEWVCGGLGLRERGNSGGSGVDVDVQRVNGDGGGVGKRGKKEGDGGTGIVIMDNVGEGGDWELVILIIGLNMGVLAKMDEATQYLN